MKYNVNYNKAQAALIVYVSAKKNISAIYRIHRPPCAPEQYAEYVNKNGIPDTIPQNSSIKENFKICRNAEAIINYVLSSNPSKSALWSFILNEDYFKCTETVKQHLVKLEHKGIVISRATYYREQAAFINAFAEALGLGSEYTDKKTTIPIILQEGKDLLI